MMELREITQENFEACLKLQVAPEQRTFVAPNIYSLAQAYINRETARPFALYNDGELVGFTLLLPDKQTPDAWWVCRLMIDRSCQRRGHGRRAMGEILSFLKEQGARRVFLSFEPENQAARELYRSFGFAETGETDGEGELIMALDLPGVPSQEADGPA